jgi:tetratricopeptide (TPR) repeat protein
MSDQIASATDIYRLAQKYQRQGDLAEARSCLMNVLALEPEHAEAIHSLGNIDAREGRLDDAERLIRKAIAIDPLKAAFLNSLGNLMRSRGDLEEAVKAYQLAVQLQPGIPAVHNNLAEVLLRSGDPEGAVERCFKALKADPNYAGAYDTMGRAFNNLGRLDEAIDAFRRAVVIRPDYSVAYDHLGHVFRTRGDMEEARDAFEHALVIDPENASALYNLGTVLTVQGKLEEGIDHFERAAALRPRHVPTLLNLGIAYHTRGQLKLSAETYRKAIRVAPGDPVLHLNLGLVRVEQRRGAEAEKSLLEALRLDPKLVRAYAELAALYEETNQLDELDDIIRQGLEMAADDPRLNLEAAKSDRRAGRISEGLERLGRFDPDAMDPRLAEQFRYQLGYLNDRAGNAGAAMENFREANRMASETVRARKARPERFLGMLERLTDFFESAPVDEWPAAPSGDDSLSPIFMFGFPRSGTTLLDVALDGHPSVVTVEEQTTILPVIDALRAGKQGFPEELAALDGAAIDTLRGSYRDALTQFAPAGFQGRIIDKMPIRTVYAGILWRLFPQARFIFCLRHPCDVVLSNFMQHYTPSDAFANFFTLEGTVKLYDAVMNLWAVYVERLPLICHTVRYESLVENMEGELRAVLEFLDLPWEPSVLEYTTRARSRGRINTNSYHQVTEPLYTHASGRWRAYEPYLEPHMELLAPHLERFGYEA